MNKLEIIPEEIWDKNRKERIDKKARWLDSHFEVVEFCQQEGLKIFQEKPSPPKKKNKPVFKRVI